MGFGNLYQRLIERWGPSSSIGGGANSDSTVAQVGGTPRQIDATPITIDEVLRVFEQRDAQHLSGRLWLPQEMTNIAEYFNAMGVRFIADPDDAIKYSILLDGGMPNTPSGEGASPVAIYGGHFSIPPNDIFLYNYKLLFNNRAELVKVVSRLRTTKAYGDVHGIFPDILTATLGDGTKIEARAVDSFGTRGLTTKDSYTLSVK